MGRGALPLMDEQMNLVLRRFGLLTIITGGVFGLSWVLLLLMSRLFLGGAAPIALGTLLQASAGSFCFAYGVMHLRSQADPPPVAQSVETLGIIAIGVSLWIIAGRYLMPATIPLRAFALPSQASMLLGGASLITGRLLRRYHASKRHMSMVMGGAVAVSAALIVLLTSLWYL